MLMCQNISFVPSTLIVGRRILTIGALVLCVILVLGSVMLLTIVGITLMIIGCLLHMVIPELLLLHLLLAQSFKDVRDGDT